MKISKTKTDVFIAILYSVDVFCLEFINIINCLCNVFENVWKIKKR